ncbi:Ldh family oxidoreductase [Janibacter sp. GS2]|uniref:Ldh family oxidoreductase n=1 Tax=Janibacter sp. GS2 TaxID=3442646 RepID=UPI003EB6C53F
MSESTLLSLRDLHRLATDVLTHVGMPADHAGWTADGLVWADAHGLPAHGVATKLVQCVQRIRAGGTLADPRIRVLADRPAHQLIDADHAWGQPVGTLAMLRAVEMARTQGVAAVSVRDATSAAAMGYFADLAADRGCIGLAATNGPALIAAPGGRRRVVGNQGHALAAPGDGDERLLYDTATTTMSTGEMDGVHERGERLPEGVLRDAQGEPTTDPSQWTTGLLEPIGGHRGFGLSLALEVLTGVLAGGGRFGADVGLPTRHDQTQGVSLLMLAIAPVEGEDLTGRVHRLIEVIGASGDQARAPGVNAVRRARHAREHGVEYSPAQVTRLADLAASCGVTPLPA